MNSNDQARSQETLLHETQEIWNQLGSWWDERIGESGNEFHRTLIAPTTTRLLSLQPGEKVLYRNSPSFSYEVATTQYFFCDSAELG